MNLAFTALLALLLSAPGFACIYAFRAGRGRPRTSRPFVDDLPLALMVVVVIHAICATAVNVLGRRFGVAVDAEAVLILLSNAFGDDGRMFSRAAQSVVGGYRPLLLVAYFVISCILGAVVGWILRWLVERFMLDAWVPALRANDWYYLLKGETPLRQRIDSSSDGVRLTAVVGDYIYWGILYDYYIAGTGVLDSIVLAVPKRRKLGEGEDTQADPGQRPACHEINAYFLILKYSECKNIGVLMVKLDEEFSPPPGTLPTDDRGEQENAPSPV